jgi:hypothetical protein
MKTKNFSKNKNRKQKKGFVPSFGGIEGRLYWGGAFFKVYLKKIKLYFHKI